MKCYDKRSQTGGGCRGRERGRGGGGGRSHAMELPEQQQQHLERTHAYVKVARRGLGGQEGGRGVSNRGVYEYRPDIMSRL